PGPVWALVALRHARRGRIDGGAEEARCKDGAGRRGEIEMAGGRVDHEDWPIRSQGTRMHTSKIVARIALIGALFALGTAAHAQQSYPSRPVRYIIPFPP